jgi:hypothetical protein
MPSGACQVAPSFVALFFAAGCSAYDVDVDVSYYRGL